MLSYPLSPGARCPSNRATVYSWWRFRYASICRICSSALGHREPPSRAVAKKKKNKNKRNRINRSRSNSFKSNREDDSYIKNIRNFRFWISRREKRTFNCWNFRSASLSPSFLSGWYWRASSLYSAVICSTWWTNFLTSLFDNENNRTEI